MRITSDKTTMNWRLLSSGVSGALPRNDRQSRSAVHGRTSRMILQQHRMRLFKAQAPGLAKGLMLPSNVGTYRTPNSLDTDGRFEVRAFRFPKRARTIDPPMSP